VSLTLRTGLASALLALLIASVFAVLLEASLDQREARRDARHSRAQLARAQGLLQLVVDLETGQRGFVITGRQRFLEPWTAARTTFPGEARSLADSAHDQVQATRARKLARDGISYIEDYSVPLVEARRRNAPAASSGAVTDAGKRRVDALRVEFARFTSTERRHVMSRQSRVDAAAGRALSVAGAGLGVSILLIAGFAGYLGRAVLRPVGRAADMAGRLSAGDLAVRMPETGAGEIGHLQRSFNSMGSSLEKSRDELSSLAEEQAALRRVATLVARAVPPDEVLDSVAAEVGQVLGADGGAALVRCEPDGTVVVVANRGRHGPQPPVGTRYPLTGVSAAAEALRSGRVTRLDTADRDPNSLSPGLRDFGVVTAVAAPIVVGDRAWGVIIAGWRDTAPPRGTERRLAEFTELAATAIANAESRAALTASRARVVAAADETRRRIERDLHDGAQQRLVHTIISLKLARQAVGGGDSRGQLLDDALENAKRASAQLRELVRGVLPSALKRAGLRGGVESLASRSGLAVTRDVTAKRLPAALEATAYFIVAEALTNTAKHARAAHAEVRAFVDAGVLHVEVRDDGIGGARLEGGSGLLGLLDRAGALGGELRVESPAGRGTTIAASLPLSAA
jgi:signal transduction histidine kinase